MFDWAYACIRTQHQLAPCAELASNHPWQTVRFASNPWSSQCRQVKATISSPSNDYVSTPWILVKKQVQIKERCQTLQWTNRSCTPNAEICSKLHTCTPRLIAWELNKFFVHLIVSHLPFRFERIAAWCCQKKDEKGLWRLPSFLTLSAERNPHMRLLSWNGPQKCLPVTGTVESRVNGRQDGPIFSWNLEGILSRTEAANTEATGLKP